VIEVDRLWLDALQDVMGRAAHEVKDSLNGVSLNLEVIRSRTARSGADNQTLAVFSTAALEQLELLSLRTEAVLFLTRQGREPADIALTLRHLASLLIPAAKADGNRLSVEGYQTSAPTAAPVSATRLALAAGLLALTNERGAGRCTLEAGAETVVRFSHESASPLGLESSIASAIAEHSIRNDRSGADLILVFPGQL